MLAVVREMAAVGATGGPGGGLPQDDHSQQRRGGGGNRGRWWWGGYQTERQACVWGRARLLDVLVALLLMVVVVMAAMMGQGGRGWGWRVALAAEAPPAPVTHLMGLEESVCVMVEITFEVRCWGRNAQGQLGQGDATSRGDDKWELGSNLTAVDLGTGRSAQNRSSGSPQANHVCMVLDNGDGKCWGSGGFGRLGYEDTSNRGDDPGELGDALPALNLGNNVDLIVHLATGSAHSCAQFRDGRVKCWGWSFVGQLGYEDTNSRGDGAGEMGDSLPFVNFGSGLSVEQLFVGDSHSCARLNDTSHGLKCWGSGSDGRLGYEDTNSRGDEPGEMGDSLPFVNLGSHVRTVRGDAGLAHNCFLLNDTSVKCFGNNANGRLGYGDTVARGDDPGEMGDALTAIDVLGSATGVVVTDLACSEHSCAKISDGSLKCWGKNSVGQLGLGDTVDRGGGAGEMGDALPLVSLGPVVGVQAVALHLKSSCVLLNDSSVKCFGDNANGQLGLGDIAARGDGPGEMGSALPLVDIGPAVTAVPTPAPTAAPTLRPTLPQLAPIVQVLALYESTCSLQASPTSDLRCWGRNNFGQLGQGDATDRGGLLWQMGENLSAVDLGTGLEPRPNITTTTLARHSCHVLDPPGSVKCFGRGSSGQLGYGDLNHRGDDPGELGDALPAVDLGSSLPPILHLAQGGFHNCVLFAQDLRIKCWGYSFYGQLGYEDTSSRGDGAGQMGDSLPFVDLGAGFGVVELLLGYYHTCACLNDTSQGGLKCWGRNVDGQLGYGDANARGDGVGEMGDGLPLVSLSSSGHVHVIQGAGGSSHSCVLLNDSAVKCFGGGDNGKLGYGDTASRGDNAGEMGDSLPAVDVLGSATGLQVTQLRCGQSHSCALISDGSMKCWGYGAYGQTGQENASDIGGGAGQMGDALPVIQLGRGTHGVVSASLGQNHTCARLNDSTIKCFGQNTYGQLGQGDTDNRGDSTGEMSSFLSAVNIGPVVTGSPTAAPTSAPTLAPTAAPTISPTAAPTLVPSPAPTTAPTSAPTLAPTAAPTISPTAAPTLVPSPAPTAAPTSAPTLAPTDAPTSAPTLVPTLAPTAAPTLFPSPAPTAAPTAAPTISPAPTSRPTLPKLAPVLQLLSLQRSQCVVIAITFEVRCWGRNDVGQLGQGDLEFRGDNKWELGSNLTAVDLGTDRWVQNGSSSNAKADHLCLLLGTGHTKCWGSGALGQLGYEDASNRGDNPGEMGDALAVLDLGTSADPILHLATGSVHSCAQFRDGRVKCWGLASLGRLGYEDTVNRGDDLGEMGDSLPFVNFGSGLGVEQLFVGDSHNCARLNGSVRGLKCWGSGFTGHLGYEDTSSRGDEPGEMGDSLPYVNLGSHAHTVRGDAGSAHNCFLFNDSSVKCFGSNFNGQLGYGDAVTRGDGAGEMGDSLPAVDVLGSATGVVVLALACGSDHSCTMISDGSLKCWGMNSAGQLGLGDTTKRGDSPGEMGDALPVVTLGSDVESMAVDCGNEHTCVMLNDSSVKCFGRGDDGRLGYGDANHRGDEPGEMGSSLPRVEVGPLVTGSPTPAPTPRPTLPPLAPVTHLMGLEESVCVMVEITFEVRCWGRNAQGQLGQGDATSRGDDKWELGSNLTAVDLGTGRSPQNRSSGSPKAAHVCLVLDNGDGKCWGSGGFGQLGYEDTSNRGDDPGELGNALPALNLGNNVDLVVQIAAGALHSCAQFRDGRVKCWGWSFVGQLGYEDTNSRGDGAGEMGDSLPFVNFGSGLGVEQLFVGDLHNCAGLNDTSHGLKCWGSGSDGRLGYEDTNGRGAAAGEMGDSLPFVNIGSNVHVVRGNAGVGHNCFLLNDSSVKCFGYNSNGRLGYEDTSNRGDGAGEMGDALPAVDVLGTAAGVVVTDLACSEHSCAMISDGSLKCWGLNTVGQLGMGDTVGRGGGAGEMGNTLTPVPLGSAIAVQQMEVGDEHTCVLLNDSSVKCFGDNTFGQLGQGDSTNRGDGPAEMGSSLTRVDVGPLFTLLPTAAPTSAPSPLTSVSPTLQPTRALLAPVRSIHVGYEFSCAHVDISLAVMCWGRNDGGQLAQGDTISRGDDAGEMGVNTSIVHFGLGASVQNLTTGFLDHSCAVLSGVGMNPEVACWGSNGHGQLGVGDVQARGNTANETVIVDVVDLGNAATANDNHVAQLALGSFFSCARFRDGRVKCWGKNSAGQLGLGDTTTRGATPADMGDSLPFVPLGPGLRAVYLMAGSTHTCALLNDSSSSFSHGLKCWGGNADGQLGYEDVAVRGDNPGEMGAALPFVSLGEHVHAMQGSVGGAHSCFLLNDSSVKCFGANGAGQLGYGDTASRGDGAAEMGSALPTVEVLGPNESFSLAVCHVVAGNLHSCVVFAADGGIKCWGYNSDGQLGYEDADSRGDGGGEMGNSLPLVQLGNALTVDGAPSLGSHHTCVLLNDSTVKCFGKNEYGQLGYEDTQNRGDGVGQMANSLPVVNVGPFVTQTPSLAPSVSPAPTFPATLPALAPVVAIRSGALFTCATLDTTWAVNCWGKNDHGELGQGSVDDHGNGNFHMGSNLTAVDFGVGRHAVPNASNSQYSEHSCAVLSPNREVVCWGNNPVGQLGYGDTVARGATAAQLGYNLGAVDLGTSLQPVAAVTTSTESSCALFENGKLKCWGGSTYGQLGYEDIGTRGNGAGAMGDALPFVNLGVRLHTHRLFSGGHHNCVILNDSSVKCFGRNDEGQLGLGDTSHRGDNVGEMGDGLACVNLSSAAGFATQLALATKHSCALLNDSSVKCWGANFDGQLGQGHSQLNIGDSPGEMGDNLVPSKIIGSAGTASPLLVTSVHVCADSSCVVLNDGSLRCFGSNIDGQLGYGDTTDRGASLSQLGHNLSAVAIGPAVFATDVSMGADFTCVLLNDSSAKCFGRNNFGQLGSRDTEQRGDNAGEMGAQLPRVDVGPLATAAPTLVPTITAAPTPFPSLPLLAPVASVHASGRGFCVILDTSYDVRCWGDNANGQLGQGDTDSRGDGAGEMGVNMSTLEFGSAAGRTSPGNMSRSDVSDHYCILLNGGAEMKCWGDNSCGQLGYGDTTNRGSLAGQLGDSLPFVDLGSNGTAHVTQVSASSCHTCALMRNGQLKCWGDNANGQLGLNDNNTRGDDGGEMGDALPFVQVGTGRRVQQVECAGHGFTVVLLDDGSVKAFGRNAEGQLGYEDTSVRGDDPGEMGDALPAIALGSGRAAVQVAAGGNTACALLDDSTVKCWGDNGFGQLGQGDVTSRGDNAGEMGDSLTPISLFGPGEEATAGSVAHVMAGFHFVCIRTAVTSQLKCWGSGSSGQLGLEDPFSRGNSPGSMGGNLSFVALGSHVHVAQLQTSGTGACVLLNDSSVKCWGKNNLGQLGYGDTSNRGETGGTMGNALERVDVGPLVTRVPTFAPTAAPSATPTATPSLAPSAGPTRPPTPAPSQAPSAGPTPAPSPSPTIHPSVAPTSNTTTKAPTASPTSPAPSVSPQPSLPPTLSPSTFPSLVPSASPTMAPTVDTFTTYVAATPGSGPAAPGGLAPVFVSLASAVAECARPVWGSCELVLLPGEHHVNSSIVLSNLLRFSLHGYGTGENRSTIRMWPHFGVLIDAPQTSVTLSRFAVRLAQGSSFPHSAPLFRVVAPEGSVHVSAIQLLDLGHPVIPFTVNATGNNTGRRGSGHSINITDITATNVTNTVAVISCNASDHVVAVERWRVNAMSANGSELLRLEHASTDHIRTIVRDVSVADVRLRNASLLHLSLSHNASILVERFSLLDVRLYPAAQALAIQYRRNDASPAVSPSAAAITVRSAVLQNVWLGAGGGHAIDLSVGDSDANVDVYVQNSHFRNITSAGQGTPLHVRDLGTGGRTYVQGTSFDRVTGCSAHAVRVHGTAWITESLFLDVAGPVPSNVNANCSRAQRRVAPVIDAPETTAKLIVQESNFSNNEAFSVTLVESGNTGDGILFRNNYFLKGTFRPEAATAMHVCPGTTAVETYDDSLVCASLATCRDLVDENPGRGIDCRCEGSFIGDPFVECIIPPGEIRIVPNPIQAGEVIKPTSTKNSVSLINIGQTSVDFEIWGPTQFCDRVPGVLDTANGSATVCSEVSATIEDRTTQGGLLYYNASAQGGVSLNGTNHRWTLRNGDGTALPSTQLEACSFAAAELALDPTGLQQGSYFSLFIVDAPDDNGGATIMEVRFSIVAAMHNALTQVGVYNDEGVSMAHTGQDSASFALLRGGQSAVVRILAYDVDNVTIPAPTEALKVRLIPQPRSALENDTLAAQGVMADDCDEQSAAALRAGGQLPAGFDAAQNYSGSFPLHGIRYFLCPVHALVTVDYAIRVRADSVTFESFAFGSECGADYVQQNARCTCGVGEFLDPETDNLCSPCAKGSYKNVTGDQACKECQQDGMTTQSGGATRPEDCLCGQNSFLRRTLDEDGWECAKCLTGARCSLTSNTVATLRVRSEYWRATNESQEILACPAPKACIGDSLVSSQADDDDGDDGEGDAVDEAEAQWWGNELCEKGSGGPMCTVCDSGWFKVYSGRCKRCSPETFANSYILVVVLVVVGTLAIYHAARMTAVVADRMQHGDQADPKRALSLFDHFEKSMLRTAERVILESQHRVSRAKRRVSVAFGLHRENDKTDWAVADGRDRVAETTSNRENGAGRGDAADDEEAKCVGDKETAGEGEKGEEEEEEGEEGEAREENTEGKEAKHQEKNEEEKGKDDDEGEGEGEEKYRAKINARGLIVKLKILFVFFQVVLLFQTTYAVAFPTDYLDFLGLFSWLSFDWFQVAQMECAVAGGFGSELILSCCIPLGVCLVLVCVWYAARERYGPGTDGLMVVENTLINLFLLITYVLFPSLSTTIFSAFVCQEFDDGTRLLRTDYGIDCDSSYYASLVVFAGFMVVVYPIGIPALYAYCLYVNREDLDPSRRRQGMVLSDVIVHRETKVNYLKFLYDAFKPRYYAFEVFECARKLALTGFIVFVYEDASVQVYLGILISVAAVCVYCYTRPYLFKSNNYFAIFAQSQITLTLVGASMLRYNEAARASEDSSTQSSYSTQDIAMLLIVSNVLVLAMGATLIAYSCLSTSERDFLDAGYVADGKGGFRIETETPGRADTTAAIVGGVESPFWKRTEDGEKKFVKPKSIRGAAWQELSPMHRPLKPDALTPGWGNTPRSRPGSAAAAVAVANSSQPTTPIPKSASHVCDRVSAVGNGSDDGDGGVTAEMPMFPGLPSSAAAPSSSSSSSPAPSPAGAAPQTTTSDTSASASPRPVRRRSQQAFFRQVR